jgi:hypothetical protein
MTLARKLHHIAASVDTAHGLFTWRPHGRALRLVVTKQKRQILQFYFGHSDLAVLLQDLTMHGFKLITQGKDRNCFYHEVRTWILY